MWAKKYPTVVCSCPQRRNEAFLLNDVFSFSLPMSNFVHLHNHTMYSLLDGLCNPEELIETAKDMGMEAIAITDHGNMFGAVQFYEACHKAGIKPIIGMEAYLAPNGIDERKPGGAKANKPFHQLLIAKNNEGYQNLMKLNTRAHLEGFYYKPRLDKQWLEEFGQGLVATTSCMAGEIPQLLLSEADNETILEKFSFYHRCFGEDNFYVELQDHDIPELREIINQRLIHLAQKHGFPVIATNDVHYVHKDDADAQDAVICVSTNKKIEDRDRMRMTSTDYYLRSPEEMEKLFGHVPGALENTKKIADECEVNLEFEKWLLPDFECPDDYTPELYLKHQCAQGFLSRYNVILNDELELQEQDASEWQVDQQKLDQLLERVKYELSVINPMGYASYYLMVQDLVLFARREGIAVGPGRGSGAGSLVAYLCYITNLDPLDHQLLFERFLNPERASMPDFDLDFADDRREEMIHYTREKYGEDHVAHIITFGTMKAKAAVRDIGRVLGLPYSDVDRIAKLIPEGMHLQEAIDSVDELQQVGNQDPLMKQLLELSLRVEGNTRHTSVHAAAVVVSRSPLVEDIPLQKDHKTGKVTTQYSMKPAEKIGLLKIDFLGLKTLTILENTLLNIEQTQGKKMDLDRLPLDDQAAFDLFARGETLAVFQMESGGMIKLSQKLRPTEFADIVAMIALYRPGPMEWIDDFIGAKHGKRKATYPHESLAEILEPTHGIAVYQEQIQQLAQKFAGFSLGDGYILIKAIGKKIAEMIQKLKGKFIEGAMATQGVDREKAEEVFSFIEPFARYGFNKSHAACYGLITYQTAFLKANYPVEFMAAVLTSEMSNQDSMAKYITECQRMGIEILLPDINQSLLNFSVEQGNIRFGLNGVRNVGDAAVEAIVQERKEHGHFRSFSDFCVRVNSRSANKKLLESLIMAGAFDAFGHRNQHLSAMDQVIAWASKEQKSRASGQTSLFDFASAASPDAPAKEFPLPEVEEAPMEQQLSWEKELLGCYLSSHPLDPFRKLYQTERFSVLVETIEQAKESSKPVTAAEQLYGVKQKKVEGEFIIQVQTFRGITTKKGDKMGFAQVEDMSVSLEAVVFPRAYARSDSLWESGKIIRVQGKIDAEPDEDPKLMVDRAWAIEEKDVVRFLKSAQAKESQDVDPVSSSVLSQASSPASAGNDRSSIVVENENSPVGEAILPAPPEPLPEKKMVVSDSPEMVSKLSDHHPDRDILVSPATSAAAVDEAQVVSQALASRTVSAEAIVSLPLILKVEPHPQLAERLSQLAVTLQAHPGEHEVHLVLADTSGENVAVSQQKKTVKLPHRVKYSPELQSKIQAVLGRGNVVS